jgi:hypothetical protein
MGHTSGCSVVGILVDSALQLLQELVNVQKIALGPEVGEWQGIWVVHRRVLCLSHHGAAMPILRHAGALVTASTATENWKLNTLKTHEPLTNIIVSGWVDCATLGIPEELVEGIICSTLPNLVVVVELLRLVYCIVDRAISGVLGWTSIESSWSTTWVLLSVASVGAKGTIRILVSACCSGKRLQVSDEFAVLARVALGGVGTTSVGFRGAEQDGIVGVRLYVLLEILRTLERLTAEIALVRLQRNVNANVRSDVVTLDRGGAAVAPLAGQIQVVGALTTNMALTNVIVELLSRGQTVTTVLPLTNKLVA